MAFKQTKSWKEELRGYCPCFCDSKHPFGLKTDPFCDYEKCPANNLRKAFLAKTKPTQTEVILAMLETSNFNRKQLIGILTDLFSCSANTAATRVASILRPYREKLIQDAHGRYFLVTKR